MWRDPINFVLTIAQLLLFVLSIIFTIGVASFKGGIKSKAPGQVASGSQVSFSLALDGDEVAVKANDVRYVVRIMGIKSFEGGLGKTNTAKVWDDKARAKLDKLAGSSVRLEFPEYKLDKSGRLLSYVHANDTDAGLDLIKEGLAFAYDKYEFSRLAEYMVAEAKARKGKLGYWQFPAIAGKVDKLREVWSQ